MIEAQPDPRFDREPPHNFDAEQAFLGAVLHDNGAYHQCLEIIEERQFADPLHARLYSAMAKLIDRGLQANVFALKTFADADPEAAKVGGARYLAGMLAASAGHEPKQMARIVRDLYLRRQLIALSQSLAAEAYADDPAMSAVDQIEATERKLYDLAEAGYSEGGFQPFSKALTGMAIAAEAAHQRKGKLVGLSTGLRALDATLGGLHSSDLIVLAGRPSMGKTALATNMAFAIADAFRFDDVDGTRTVTDGGVVGFFSLEMSAEQLACRIVSERAEIPSERIRRGELNASEFDRTLEAVSSVQAAPIFIDDTAALTLSGLRTRARRLKRQHGLNLLVVDYLQLIQPPPGRRNENRVQEISEITRGLKAIAKDLNVPVLALSQLSRATEQREDKRPQLSDLRDSGSIEQDADVVMFVYREEYYLARLEPKSGTDKEKQEWREKMISAAGKAEVLIQKQRHGPTADVQLRFDGKLTRFSDWDDGR